MSTAEIPKRLLKEAESTSRLTVAKMTTAYQTSKVKSWADLIAQFKLTNEDLLGFDAKTFCWPVFKAWTQAYQLAFEHRIKSQLTAEMSKTKADVKVDKAVETFGKTTLKPEQQGVVNSIFDAFFISKSTCAALQDGKMGSGKTVIAAALIAKHIKSGALTDPINAIKPFVYIVFTPKNVVEHYKRELERMGLGRYIGNKIIVTSYSQFSTAFGKMLIEEHTSLYDDEETILKWNPIFAPAMVVWDECQKLNNAGTYQTKCAISLSEAGDCRQLFMSGTPWEKVNDARAFVCALKQDFYGLPIGPHNFNVFANNLDGTPEKPNIEACKRLRKVLAPYIFSMPYVKWPHKPITQVVITDFESPAQEQLYKDAHAIYLAACAKAGKNTEFARFGEFVALNNFRKAVEPMRVPFLVKRIVENYRRGDKATIVATAYKETLIRAVFQCAEAGIPRSEISIIWGGGKRFNPDDILPKSEIDRILTNPDLGRLTPELLRKLRITIRFMDDATFNQETPEQQAYRHRRMAELKLTGTQSADQRQLEIDRFQSGQSKVCFFTNASGGVGLSLDRDKEHLLPREMYVTPVYNGKEFAQVLGRPVRRMSLSDANIYVCYMRGTVEHYHVAPIVDNKLKCIAEVTGRAFDVIDILKSSDKPVSLPEKFRDAETARVDAHEDDSELDRVDTNEDEDEDLELAAA